jgi:hypothetical protein
MTVSYANDRSKTKYRSSIKDENHFISSLFTLRASRRLPYAALPARHREPLRRGGRVKGSKSRQSGTISPLSVLPMAASDSCKIQVIKNWLLRNYRRVVLPHSPEFSIILKIFNLSNSNQNPTLAVEFQFCCITESVDGL